MAVPQQKFRELVFQMLYSYDTGKGVNLDNQLLLMKELAVTKKTVFLAQDRIDLVKAKIPELDKIISKASHSYKFERIPSVERNILRLGIYELMFDESIPPKVAIAEAMRLARKFSSPEAGAFINALLDHIYQAKLGEKGSLDKLQESVDNLKQNDEWVEKTVLEQPAPEEDEDEEGSS
jgi:transcription antitermination protein NusB